MASGIIWTPEERTTQPQGVFSVNTQLGLPRGTLLVVPSGGARVTVSDSRILLGTYNGLVGAGVGPLGRNILSTSQTPSTTPGLILPAGAIGFAGYREFTVLAIARITSSDTSGAPSALFRIDESGGGNANIGLAWIHTSGSTIQFQSLIATSGVPGWNSATFCADDSPTANALNVPIIIAMRWVEGAPIESNWSVIGGGPRAWVSSAYTPTGITTFQGSTLASMRLVISGLSYSTSSPFPGEIYGIGFVPSRISDALYRRVVKNPWQLFEADNEPVFYSLGGGSNNTAALSSTLDSATLTGIGAVVRSGTLAVTLDAATLSGIGGVSLSGTLASTLAAAALTGVGAITTSGTLSVTLEAATLAGVGSVAVGTNRDGTLAVTLEDATVTGTGAVTRSATLAVTLDNTTLAGIGTAGQAVTGTLSATLDNVRLTGIGAIPAAPSQGGGNSTGRNLSRKQKKKLKAVESQEWLKAEETARQLLNDRFTKQTPQEKAEALQTYVESLQPIIEALKALTTQIEEVKEVVEDAPVMELTPHQEILTRFDTLEKKLKSVEELVIILMADL